MRGFFKNSKGAVTVFVTLLMVPTLLVTGTGVDLARIYAARSSVRNANQLAANSTLTYYDSLLQDLYGLFGVMRTDEELAGLVDAYIKASLFNENADTAQMGEFRLFWREEDVDVTVLGGEKLSDVDVLRRQIEEYAKWRAPVAIVLDIIDRFQDNEAFSKADADNDVLRDKDAIDTQLENLCEIYNNLYDKVEQLQKDYNNLESQVYADVNNLITKISEQHTNLKNVRTAYQNEVDTDRKESLQAQYIAIMENIENIVNGTGTVGSSWNHDEREWRNTTPAGIGIDRTINNGVEILRGFQSRFDELITLSRQADQAKQQVQTAITNLETKLRNNRNSYTENLPEGIEEELNDYKELLRHNYENLATQMKDRNATAIESGAISTLRNINAFGQVASNSVTDTTRAVSYATLSSLVSYDVYPIWFDGPDNDDLLLRIVNATKTYTAPGSFIRFENISTAHKQAHDALKIVPGSNGQPQSEQDKGRAEESKMEGDSSSGTGFRGIMRTLGTLTGLSDNDTGGADRYSSSNKPLAFSVGGGVFNIGGSSLASSNTGNKRSFLGDVRKLMNGNLSITDVITQALSDLANKALLVTYCNEMFTDYTTGRPNSSTVSMSGHTFSPQINYFYRSEIEYIIAGHTSAMANLRSVSWMILTIRILANLVASYTIKEVRNEIKTMSNLVAAIPYVGKILKFLVRPLYIIGESVNDLKRLRDGEAVSLVKTKNNWTFWIGGATIPEEEKNEKLAIYYRDYLTVFLLFGNPDRLAARTGNLIMLNVTNVKHSIGPNHGAMEGLSRASMFDFDRVRTTFEITTSTNLRFMFLSLPYAQGSTWIDASPPRSFPIRQTDYRGY